VMVVSFFAESRRLGLWLDLVDPFRHLVPTVSQGDIVAGEN
jgi:hypothetical protein